MTSYTIDWEAFSAIFTAVAGIFAYKAYRISQHQRQIENSFKLIDLFYKTLDNKVLLVRRTLFAGSLSNLQVSNIEILGTDLLKEIINAVTIPVEGSETTFKYDERNKALRTNKPDTTCSIKEFFDDDGPDYKRIIETVCALFDLFAQSVKEKAAAFDIIYFELGQYFNLIGSWMTSSTEIEKIMNLRYPNYYWLYTIKGEKGNNWLNLPNIRHYPFS